MKLWWWLFAVVLALVFLALTLGGGQAEYKFSYEMRTLIEAKYGDGAGEFGKKDWDGQVQGAICFDVDSSGFVYIYDGPKGDIKIYDADGIYRRTAKALPWIVGRQMLADMSVGPAGTIYLVIDTGRYDERMRLYSISPDGEQLEELPLQLRSDVAMKDSILIGGSVWLTADVRGDVYLVDRHTYKSVKVVSSGKAVSADEQLAPPRRGSPSKWGYWVVDDSVRMSRPGPRGMNVYWSDGTLKSRITGFHGIVSGTDGDGNIYEYVCESQGYNWTHWINVITPQGQVEARIELPKIPEWTEEVGKGTRHIVGHDGSIYKLVGERDRVRVCKWERRAAQ